MKVSEVIKLIESKTGKKVFLIEKDEDLDSEYIFAIKKHMKRQGLVPQNISRDKNYPNSFICEYKSGGNYSTKIFKNLENVLGCEITFKPKSNNELYIWFNFR